MENIVFDSLEGVGNQLVRTAAYQSAEDLSDWRIRENAQAIEAMSRLNPAMDAISGTAAIALARQLEFTHNRVLSTVYEDLNGDLIPTDSSVPAGARTHTIARESSSGKAEWFKGNSRNLGHVSTEIEEQEFKIWAAVTKVDMNFFDDMSARFAGIPLESRLRRAAERVLMEFKNEKIFAGDSAQGVPGMFNAPYCMKGVSGVTFGPGGGTATAQLAELHRLANQQAQATKSKFKPTAAAMDTRYIDYFSNTLLDTANGSNRSILECFVTDNRYISQVIEIQECAGAGVGGTDIMLFFRPGDADSAHVVVPQGFTLLPMQKDGFDWYMPAFMLYGGVNQYNPLNNYVVYATYAAS